MTKKYIYILSAIILALGIVVPMVRFGSNNIALGGVPIGNEYSATTTIGMGTNLHRIVASNRPAVLGSVIIASSSPAAIRIWNATSTKDAASTTPVVMRALIADSSAG